MPQSYSRLPSASLDVEDRGSIRSSLARTMSVAESRLNKPREQNPLPWENPPSISTRLRAILPILRTIFVYILASWGLFSAVHQALISYRAHQHDLLFSSCSCGSSVTEARSRGCQFDSLAMAWLPDHCRDDPLTAEFDSVGDAADGSGWLYFADANHTDVIDRNVVAGMGDDREARLHMSKDWHLVHCIFYWRKAYRARFNGKRVEARSDSEAHIKHCGHIFQHPGPGTVAGVELNADFEH